ncbi:UNVERIFIED_CONTAM: hypothetical protein PYX00_009721 [Menopon gallinae]|uniref:NF-kappa-B inhibitor cactus n=1 Tax=Menopon gallinae TaxID=328185 RepID=A0AAW2HD24_9NEOP
MYPNKSIDDCFSDQRTYSKSQHGMSSNKVCGKTYSESGQSFYDSGRTDSGFLSGANLVSDQNLSSDDVSSSPVSRQKSESDLDIELKKHSETYMRLDSGLDLGLNEQFSELTIEQKVNLNDLNACAKSKCSISSGFSESNSYEQNLKNKPKPSESTVCPAPQPWELYFRQDDDGDTQLHIAIIQGFIEVVFSLIRMAPHPRFLDILNDVVQSPLHLAVLTHQSRIVRQLIVSGASVERRDRHGNTPLHLACEIGDFECVKALTESIAVLEVANAGLLYSGCTQQVPQDFEERNYEGETCLHLSAYGGHLDILRHLIWFGADVNAREGKSGRTILHHAVETRNTKLLRFLLDECPIGPNGLRIDTPDYAGHTAYQLACVIDPRIARELVDRGANFQVEDISEDDHPDHNAEEAEEEISEMDNVCANLENFQRSREVVRV